MTTPHKHAALIKQWVDDQSLAIWHWNKKYIRWFEADIYMLISDDKIFLVGGNPTAPPKRMCTLGGLEFPEPETKTPENGDLFYVPTVGGIDQHIWQGYDCHVTWWGLGLVHFTKEAAKAHSLALQTANKQAIEAAKCSTFCAKQEDKA